MINGSGHINTIPLHDDEFTCSDIADIHNHISINGLRYASNNVSSHCVIERSLIRLCKLDGA